MKNAGEAGRRETIFARKNFCKRPIACEPNRSCARGLPPKHGEAKRPKHHGKLIQKQNENTTHGSERCDFVMDGIRTGEDRQTYRCASLPDSLSSTTTCFTRCAERSWTLPGNFGRSSDQAADSHIRRTLELGTFFHDEHRRQDFSNERRRLQQLDPLIRRHLRLDATAADHCAAR